MKTVLQAVRFNHVFEAFVAENFEGVMIFKNGSFVIAVRNLEDAKVFIFGR